MRRGRHYLTYRYEGMKVQEEPKKMPKRNYRREASENKKNIEREIKRKDFRDVFVKKQSNMRSQQKLGKAYKNLQICWLTDYGL